MRFFFLLLLCFVTTLPYGFSAGNPPTEPNCRGVVGSNEQEFDLQKALDAHYLQYRGVTSTVVRNSKAFVFVTDQVVADHLPKTHLGHEVEIAVVPVDLKIRSSAGQLTTDFTKAVAAANALGEKFGNEPWCMGIGVEGESDAFLVNFRVSDLEAVPYVLGEWEGVRVDSEISEVADQDHPARIELVRERAESALVALQEKISNSDWYINSQLKEVNGGYVLSVFVTDFQAADQDRTPFAIEDIQILYSKPE
ncbi:MAG TPA: hypothetical protein PLH57_03715 [Oligoflexia bacterium]|nr:hypothetical protein [Oligoflexia bacterium]